MTMMRHSIATRKRSGLTLIEILIALTMTLIVLGAMMEAFKYASGKITQGRAVIEMASQLRMVEDVLRSDLENCTVEVRPHSNKIPDGCFVYVEGARRDASGAATGDFNHLGDIDDILMMTVSSSERPFRGRGLRGEIIESPNALVVWWTSWVDRDGDNEVDFDESVRLYRRVLLIRPDLNQGLDDGSVGLADPDPPTPGTLVTWDPQAGTSNPDGTDAFFYESDIAAVLDGGNLVAVTLQDLARRENRPYHAQGSFPFRLQRPLLADGRIKDFDGTNPIPSGEDIMMTNIIGFDVKAFALNAVTEVVSNVALHPGDPGFGDPLLVPDSSATTGAFVDLNVDNILDNTTNSVSSDLTGPPALPNGTNGTTGTHRYPNTRDSLLGMTNVYDTWSPHYEYGGLALNGIDDDNANGIDDPGERVGRPPYSVPLRGLKVSIRTIEPKTKQVRQTGVVHSFVPQ